MCMGLGSWEGCGFVAYFPAIWSASMFNSSCIVLTFAVECPFTQLVSIVIGISLSKFELLLLGRSPYRDRVKCHGIIC